MATCYICGKSHAEYRRNVSTGTSNRVYYGKRGISTSTSSNYGTRSVCASCALNIDYNNRKQSFGFGFFLGLGILSGIGLIFGLMASASGGFLGFTFISATVSIVLAIVCKNSKEKAADEWYAANKGQYVDSAELSSLSAVGQKFVRALQTDLEKFTKNLTNCKNLANRCLATSTSVKDFEAMSETCNEAMRQIDVFISQTSNTVSDFCSNLRNQYSPTDALYKAIDDCQNLWNSIKDTLYNEKNEFKALKDRFEITDNTTLSTEKGVSANVPLGYKTADVFDQNYWNETFWQNVTVDQINHSSSKNANCTNEKGANALCVAVTYVKNPTIIQALIDKGCNVNLETTDGFSIPMYIINKNFYNADILSTILKAGFNINEVAGCGETLLTFALQSNPTFEIVKTLFEYGADVNITNKNGKAPITFAACQDEVSDDVMNLMLNMGLIPENTEGLQNALSLAAMKPNNVSKIEALLQAGYKLDTIVDDSQNTVLNYACTVKNNQNNIIALIDNGADINHKNISGQSPLWMAIGTCNEENAEVLIGKGADINIVEEQNITPLIAAAIKGTIKTAKLLIEKGADVNHTVENKETALSQSIRSDNANEFLDILSEAGADLKYIKEDGSTLLIDALSYDKDAYYIETVLKVGIDVNHVSNDGDFALAVALEKETHTDVIELLLKAGADKNMTTKDGNTMMQVALKNKNPEVLKYYMSVK